MTTPKSVSKMRTASRICKLSAWVIAAVGVVATILYVSTLLPIIPFIRQTQYLSAYSYVAMTSIFSTLFLVTIPTIFFTIVLYVLGTIIDYLVGKAEPIEVKRAFVEEDMDGMELDDDRVQIVPIPEMR